MRKNERKKRGKKMNERSKSFGEMGFYVCVREERMVGL